MGGFQVSLPAVDALSFRVSVAASDVRSALGSLRAEACIDTGDAELSAALTSFQQLWQAFTEGAGQALDATASSVAAAAAAYQQVDATAMVDPSLTTAFARAAASGDGGAAQLLLGPLLPGAGTR